MSNQKLLRALEDFRTNMEEFQGNMADLKHEMRAMNARVRTFDKKNIEINRGLAELRQKSKDLAAIMDRAEKLSA